MIQVQHSLEMDRIKETKDILVNYLGLTSRNSSLGTTP